MALGFSLLHDGDDVLARVRGRRLSVHRGRGEAPAYHSEGDIRSNSRLGSHGSRWHGCICWQTGRWSRWSNYICSRWELSGLWDRMSSLGLGRRYQWLVLIRDRGTWCILLVGVWCSREQELTVVHRYHRVEGCDLTEELAVPLSGSPGAVDHDHVGLVGEDVHNDASPCPLARLVGIRLVLHHYCVPHGQGRQSFSSKVEALLHLCMPLGIQLLTQVSLDPPLLPGPVPGLQGG